MNYISGLKISVILTINESIPIGYPKKIVTSDASKTGVAAHVEIDERIRVAYKKFSPKEAECSSTWRELIAIIFSLKAFGNLLENMKILWRTDNYAASLIVASGSRKIKLQEIAEEIYNFCRKRKIESTVDWIPRENITFVDALSKIPDHDDWQTTTSFFNELTSVWGPFDIDRFADEENTKLSRFNSKFYCPGTENVNAFSTPWRGWNNFLVPPVAKVPRVIHHMEASRAKGVLIVPHWPSAAFFPLLCISQGQFHSFVKDMKLFSPEGRVTQGKNKDVCFYWFGFF